MLYTSDKSGKIVLDTKENFLDMMKEHFENDEIVEPEVVRDAELKLNNEARSLARVINLGTAQGHLKKCTNTLVSNYATIPMLQGLRKDHKENKNNDPTLGPKLCPLATANQAQMLHLAT